MKLRLKSGLIFFVILFLFAFLAVSISMKSNIMEKNNKLAVGIIELMDIVDRLRINTIMTVTATKPADYSLIKENIIKLREDFIESHKNNLETIRFFPELESFDNDFKNFSRISNEMMDLQEKRFSLNAVFAEKSPVEKEKRQKIYDGLLALNDTLLIEDAGTLQYKNKESLYQYRDWEHMDELLAIIKRVEERVALLGPPQRKQLLDELNSYQQLTLAMGQTVIELEELDEQASLKIKELEEASSRLEKKKESILTAVYSNTAASTGKISTMQFLVFSMGLAIVFGLNMSIFGSVLRPLSELQKTASSIVGGDFTMKVNFESSDEMGTFIKSFNEMIRELKLFKEETERNPAKLESEVVKKTGELKEKVDDLEKSRLASLNMMEDMDKLNSELVDAQAKLKLYVKELEQLDYQKDQFISIASHELKTPLTSIRGFLDLLTRKKVSENPELRDKYIGIVFNDAKRLANLISTMLELSRMDLGTLKMAWEEVKVPDLINDVREQMDIIIKSKQLNSEYIIPDNLPVISVDRDRIVQVFSNLINNAVRYTDKGKIVVEAKLADKNILFSVSDTGLGIPKEHLGKLFTRFYQVDSVVTRKKGGTGLGLSLCKGFVEAMGGKIWVESQLGKGTTFYFTIPLERSKELKKEIDLFEDNKKNTMAPQKF